MNGAALEDVTMRFKVCPALLANWSGLQGQASSSGLNRTQRFADMHALT